MARSVKNLPPFTPPEKKKEINVGDSMKIVDPIKIQLFLQLTRKGQKINILGEIEKIVQIIKNS